MRPAPRPSHDERLGILAAAGAAILYGAAYPATAVALRSFSPLAIAGLACTIALPFVVVAAATGLIAPPSRAALNGPSLLRLIVLGGLGGLGFIAATNVAVALSGPTVTGFVAPLYAVAAALLAIPLLGEHLRPATLVAFAVAVIGTGLLAGVDPTATSSLGVAFAVGAALMFGLYLVLARRWGTRYALNGTIVTIANLVGRGPILLAIELVRSPGTVVPANPDPAAVVALLTIAFGASSTANLLVMSSVRRVPARRTSAALLLTPVSSAVIGVLVLGASLTPVQWIGGALIVLGIAGASGIVAMRRTRELAA